MKSNKNHERIEQLVSIFKKEKRWLNDDEAYELFGIKNFTTRLKQSRIVISKQDLIILNDNGFFENRSHEKAIILLEFLNSKKRYPKKQEKYKNFNIYAFAEGIKRRGLKSLPIEDYKLISANQYFSKKK